MKKRILSGLLTVAILASLLPSKVIVAEAATSDKGYESHLKNLYMVNDEFQKNNYANMSFTLTGTSVSASGTYNMNMPYDINRFWVGTGDGFYYDARSTYVRKTKPDKATRENSWGGITYGADFKGRAVGSDLGNDSDNFHIFYAEPHEGYTSDSDKNARKVTSSKFSYWDGGKGYFWSFDEGLPISVLKGPGYDWILKMDMSFNWDLASGKDGSIGTTIGHRTLSTTLGWDVPGNDPRNATKWYWTRPGDSEGGQSDARTLLAFSIPSFYRDGASYCSTLMNSYLPTDNVVNGYKRLHHVYTVGGLATGDNTDNDPWDAVMSNLTTTQYRSVVCIYDADTGLFNYLISTFQSGKGVDPDTSIGFFQSPVLYETEVGYQGGNTTKLNNTQLESAVELCLKATMARLAKPSEALDVLPSAEVSKEYSAFVYYMMKITRDGYKPSELPKAMQNLLYNLRFETEDTDRGLKVQVKYRTSKLSLATDNNFLTYQFGKNNSESAVDVEDFDLEANWEMKLLFGSGVEVNIADGEEPQYWERLVNAYISAMYLAVDSTSTVANDYPWVAHLNNGHKAETDGTAVLCGLPEIFAEAEDVVATAMSKLNVSQQQKELLETIATFDNFSLEVNSSNESFDWATFDEVVSNTNSDNEFIGTVKFKDMYEALFFMATMDIHGIKFPEVVKVKHGLLEFELAMTAQAEAAIATKNQNLSKVGSDIKDMGERTRQETLDGVLDSFITDDQHYALAESIAVTNNLSSDSHYILDAINKDIVRGVNTDAGLDLYENERLDIIRSELNERLLTEEFVFTNSLLAITTHCYDYYMYTILRQYGVGQEGEALVVKAPQYEKYLSTAKIWENDYLETEDGEPINDSYIPRLPVITDNTLYPRDATVALGTIEYAFQNLDWSDFAEEYESDAKKIQEWIDNGGSDIESTIRDLTGDGFTTAYEWAQSDVYAGVSAMYMEFFRAIVSVHSLCDEVLTIEETKEVAYTEDGVNVYKTKIATQWSPVIEKYYNLYEDNRTFFEAIEQALTIYTDTSIGAISELEPFGSMFTISKGSEMMMSDWKKGFALSSLFVPMSTNLYNSDSVSYLRNDEWTMEFYYRYGFYRKALFIANDPDCIVNKYVSGANSAVKVATLGDLLNYDRDIELFVDAGFYNSDVLKDELTNYITHSGENSGFSSLSAAHAISDIERVVKDGSYRTYSAEVASNVMPFTEEGDVDYTKYPYDAYLLSKEDILGNDEGYNGVLKDYDYSVRQSYGAVSSIYRSNTLFNKAQSLAAQSLPVFRSSKNICKIEGVHTSQYRCFYNYLALASLDNLIAKNTTLVLDEDAPIFMDIFGNIVTETGLVIIPASANATLLGEYFTPYSVGYATFVNNVEDDIYRGLPTEFYTAWCGSNYDSLIKDGSIAKDSVSKEQYRRLGLGYFTPRESGFSLTNTVISDGAASIDVVWSTINTNAENLRAMLFSRTYMAGANMYTSTMINTILEVLRGAPIENIDYAKEGLEVVPRADEMGVYAAYKLENLIKMLHTDSDGTPKFQMTFSILDVFHIAAAERIAAISVKVFLVGALVLLFIQIIVQASEGRMPWKAAKQVVSGACLVGLAVALVPSITNWTYTRATSALLQREAASLLMLSQDRKSTGVEIGVLSMNTPREITHLVTKIGELDVAWYDSLLYAVGTPMMASFEDMYKEAASTNILAQQEHVFMSGKDIYADLGSILDSTRLMYNPATGILTNVYVGEDKSNTSLSYLTPYYVILDQLVANVNKYNLTNSVAPLSWSIGNDGAIVTTDMIAPYLQSVEFLDEGYDVLGMTHILDASGYASQYAPIFNDSQIETMRRSAWYPELKSADERQEISDELIAKARYFASSYSDYYGLISDSTFLKSMAMYLAIEFNAMADIETFNTFELKCIDTQDLLRYICGEPDDLFRYYKHSFARYVYNVSELPGVILGALLWLVFSLTNCCRVLSFVITLIVAVVSIVYHKIIKKEEDFEIYGYAIMTGAVTLLNLVYALVLKVELNLTSWGVAPLVAMVIAIITQIIYAIATMGICWIQMKNWKTLNSVVAHVGNQIVNKVNNIYSSSAQDNNKARKSTGGGVSERTYEALVAHDFNRREGNIQ